MNYFDKDFQEDNESYNYKPIEIDNDVLKSSLN